VDPLVALLHERTRRLGRLPAGLTERRSPKAYPRMRRHALSAATPLVLSLSQALDARRSHHLLDRDRALSKGALAQLVRWSAGRAGRANGDADFPRLYASAGGCYPIELYVVARMVDGLCADVYHWRPDAHELEELPVGRDCVARTFAALQYPWHRDAAAVCVITGVLGRTMEKYGPGGYRFAVLEAGAVLQNLGLVAAALGLAGCAIGNPLFDATMEELLRLEPGEEVVLVGYAVGWPGALDPGTPELTTAGENLWIPAVETPDGDVPYRPILAVPVDRLRQLPLWGEAGRVPVSGAMQAAEGVLGLRLAAELPRDLSTLPAAAWSAYDGIHRLRGAGLPLHWQRVAAEPDDPRIHMVHVRLGERGEGFGADGFCEATALRKATAEAVERYVSLERPLPASRLRRGSPAVNGDGLSLDSLAGYTSRLRLDRPNRLQWTGAHEFHWIEGFSLTAQRPRWVPAQLVAARGPETVDLNGEPELRPRVTTGTAAHADRSAAILHGLLEVIERDAFMLTWLCRVSAGLLELDRCGEGRLLELCERFAAARLEARAVVLKTDVPVGVVLGILRDPTGIGPAVAVGAAARADMGEAAVAALTEAFATWRVARRLQREGRTVPEENAMLDHHTRLLWWAEPERSKELGWLLNGPRVEVPARPPAPAAPEIELERLVAWFRQAGEDVIVVDLTDEALASQFGHHVVSVVVPGFHPLHLREDRPALWSRRLERAIAELGLPTPPALNPLPHPFP
jgi:ribosomal protein S12 methylthiotransferase accessory factor